VENVGTDVRGGTTAASLGFSCAPLWLAATRASAESIAADIFTIFITPSPEWTSWIFKLQI
jgi:hypothetical protein